MDYEFIEEQGLSWIENLITGNKRLSAKGIGLDDPRHPNHYMDYVQDYLAKYGVRKCEANALVIRPVAARDFCRSTIESYLGGDALDRFQKKRQEIVDELEAFRQETGLDDTISGAIDLIDENEEEY